MKIQGDEGMANLKLKKTILEVVDNQLKANDPPCTKDAYEKKSDLGYFMLRGQFGSLYACETIG